jgi:NaMN:DMB phosphoribosyltransferase
VNQYLARDEVRQAMLGQGVTPQAALERVAAMSDAEVAQLAGRIEQAPAGGDVLGILFTVFIVLLVTDIMGFTKVFPFTRSVR